ncbi:hypothetical protein, partial [Klebsiella pneumoniae]|uniref:hypothetical protein n=1 Tax=Klebsiella pneumoniae TaxID=573 RepID=UPI003F51E5E1
IFLEALQRDSADECTAFLEETCRHEPETRREIERLIVAHARIGDFLEKLPPEVSSAAQQSVAPDVTQHELKFLDPPTRPDSLGRLAHYEIL